MRMKRLKKGDKIIAAAVILLSAALFLASFFLNRNTAGLYAEISVGGVVVSTLPLDKNTDFDTGEGVLIRVADGKVYVAESDCPDKLCVRQGKIEKPGQMIVCLPNRVVVKIVSENSRNEGVDAVA